MKLLSGHEVVEVTGDDKERQNVFKAYVDVGMIRLQPGNWFFLKTYAKFADSVYRFPFKSEDVLIMTYPKSGTTWTQEIVWTMMNNPDLDNPESGKPLDVRSPFLEQDFLVANPYMKQFLNDCENPQLSKFNKICPGKDPNDGKIVQMTEAIQGRRIIKTHNPLSLFDPKLIDTCKIIYVARNPKDVCISYFHHSKLIRGHDYQGSQETFVDLFVDDSLLWSPYWNHIKEAWNQRSHRNVHFIFYEDLKSNPTEQIDLLAKFLEKSLSKKQLQNILEFTSFGSMKNRSIELDLIPAKFTNTDELQNGGGFFRKGESGDGKQNLTEEQLGKIDAWTRKNTNDMDGIFKYKLM